MKIGIDGRFFRSETGGLGRYTQELIKEILKIDQENQYILFITDKDFNEAKQLLFPNLEKVRTQVTHYTLAEQTAFLKLLLKHNLDLVHFTNFNHPIFYPKKFVVTIHDLTMFFYPVGRSQKSKIRQWAMKKVIQNALFKAKKVIAISKNTKNDLIKHFKAPPDKIIVIYEGVGSLSKPFLKDEEKKVLKEYNVETPFLLFVSQWRPHKGIIPLIQAFEILKEKHKELQLVLVGKPNPSFPEILKSIEYSKYKNDIITPGFVNDRKLNAFYATCSLFIFPSFYEGFGLPPLEAINAGATVVSSNQSCLPEILDKAAAFFDPHDIKKMVEEIDLLLTHREVKDKLKKEAKVLLQKFNWQKTAKETLKVYNEVLSE